MADVCTGIHTIESLSYASKRELSDIKGMSDAKVVKLKEAGAQGRAGAARAGPAPALHALTSPPPPLAASKYVPTGFTTATMVMEQRSDIIKLTTGCKALDDILGGAPLPLPPLPPLRWQLLRRG